VALIATVSMYLRLRSARAQLSNALVLAGGHQHGAQTGDQAGIRLQDNI
jgi:hypothetical protein